MTAFGVHTNIQDNDLNEVLAVAEHADRLGYDWFSVSDHFPGGVSNGSLESTTTQAAVACRTSRITCAVLVHGVPFRHPAVLATAATTLDHLSLGRAAIGLGIGGSADESRIYGFAFPSVSERLDMLEESVQYIRAMLHNEVADFSGTYFRVTGARNDPRPVQARLPIWIGTGGDRGLGIVARHANGWNLGHAPLPLFVRKRQSLLRQCAAIGRDPSEVKCAVNLGLAPTAEALTQQFGPATDRWSSASLVGTVEAVLDGIGTYVAAGADQINFYVRRPPYDLEYLEALAVALGLPSSQ